MLQQALDHGLPANLTNDKGDSLLMLAAYHGHVDALRLLISKGADTNRMNDRGQSPLAGVVFKHEKECIEILLEAGADPEVGTPSALDATKVRSPIDLLNLIYRLSMALPIPLMLHPLRLPT